MASIPIKEQLLYEYDYYLLLLEFASIPIKEQLLSTISTLKKLKK